MIWIICWVKNIIVELRISGVIFSLSRVMRFMFRVLGVLISLVSLNLLGV